MATNNQQQFFLLHSSPITISGLHNKYSEGRKYHFEKNLLHCENWRFQGSFTTYSQPMVESKGRCCFITMYGRPIFGKNSFSDLKR